MKVCAVEQEVRYQRWPFLLYTCCVQFGRQFRARRESRACEQGLAGCVLSHMLYGLHGWRISCVREGDDDVVSVVVGGGKMWMRMRRSPACGCLESALRVRRSCRLSQKGILLEPHIA